MSVSEKTPYAMTISKSQEKVEDGLQGITSRLHLAPGIPDFFQFKEGLIAVVGMVLYNNKTSIPSTLIDLMLDTQLSAHQGVSCMTSRAESSDFGPGITPDIANIGPGAGDTTSGQPVSRMALRFLLRN